MKFTCNEIKNQTNIEQRGLPLLLAELMFNAQILAREDTRKEYPERRYIGYNKIDGRLMVVVFCLPSIDHAHIISFRKANEREQRKFESNAL